MKQQLTWAAWGKAIPPANSQMLFQCIHDEEMSDRKTTLPASCGIWGN